MYSLLLSDQNQTVRIKQNSKNNQPSFIFFQVQGSFLWKETIYSKVFGRWKNATRVIKYWNEYNRV